MKISQKKKRTTQQKTAKPYFLTKEWVSCRTRQNTACLNPEQGNSECVCELVAVHKLVATSLWQVSTEMESNILKTLIAIWHCNFISVYSNNKTLAFEFCMSVFLIHFSSYSMLLYFTKVSVHSGLEVFFSSFTTESEKYRKVDISLM